MNDARDGLQRLANHPLLAPASVASVETILKAARIAEHVPGACLLQEGADERTVKFLLRGVARIQHVADGRLYTPKLLQAPGHFGELETLAGFGPSRQSVTAVSGCLVASVAWAVIEPLLRTDNAMCFAWLRALGQQFVFTIDADRHNVFTPLAGRMANALLSYADAFGVPERAGVLVRHTLSLQDIADTVGSVKRVVLRVLQGWAKQDVIASTPDGALIKRIDVLRKATLTGRLGLLHATRDG